jgi:hypothetical protein
MINPKQFKILTQPHACQGCKTQCKVKLILLKLSNGEKSLVVAKHPPGWFGNFHNGMTVSVCPQCVEERITLDLPPKASA